MWKLLSGIALVVLLDLAFIWMMAAQPDAPEIARAIGPTAAVPVIHEQPDAEPVAIDDSVEPELEENSADLEYVRGTRSNSRRSGNSDRVAQPEGVTVSATGPQKLFEDTVIWIGRTEVPVKIDQRDDSPVLPESKEVGTISASVGEPEPKIVEKRKRSFQSKAFSVIKKPYDWMKSAVDKLN